MVAFDSGGRHRSEIAWLRTDQLTVEPVIAEDGPPPAVHQSRSHQNQRHRQLRGHHLTGRPVEAFVMDSVFRKVDRWDNVSPWALDPKSFNDIVNNETPLAMPCRDALKQRRSSGQLVNLRIFFNEKYCKAPGMGIENIVFKNVSYNGSGEELSMISGYNDERKIKNVVFQNLRINGKLITDDMPDKPKWYKTGDMARIFTGEHVEGVTFIP